MGDILRKNENIFLHEKNDIKHLLCRFLGKNHLHKGVKGQLVKTQVPKRYEVN